MYMCMYCMQYVTLHTNLHEYVPERSDSFGSLTKTQLLSERGTDEGASPQISLPSLESKLSVFQIDQLFRELCREPMTAALCRNELHGPENGEKGEANTLPPPPPPPPYEFVLVDERRWILRRELAIGIPWLCGGRKVNDEAPPPPPLLLLPPGPAVGVFPFHRLEEDLDVPTSKRVGGDIAPLLEQPSTLPLVTPLLTAAVLWGAGLVVM